MNWKVGDEFMCTCGCGTVSVISELLEDKWIDTERDGNFYSRDIRPLTKLEKALR